MKVSSAAAEIVFDHVTKRLRELAPARGRRPVDHGPGGEICVLIGPSGGGKSTAMRMVNRLISITEGEITIDGQSVQRLDPVELRRGIGHVIQQIGLFPHMTIEANVGTVPRLLGWERPGEYDSRQCAGSGVIVSRRCPHR